MMSVRLWCRRPDPGPDLDMVYRVPVVPDVGEVLTVIELDASFRVNQRRWDYGELGNVYVLLDLIEI